MKISLIWLLCLSLSSMAIAKTDQQLLQEVTRELELIKDQTQRLKARLGKGRVSLKNQNQILDKFKKSVDTYIQNGKRAPNTVFRIVKATKALSKLLTPKELAQLLNATRNFKIDHDQLVSTEKQFFLTLTDSERRQIGKINPIGYFLGNGFFQEQNEKACLKLEFPHMIKQEGIEAVHQGHLNIMALYSIYEGMYSSFYYETIIKILKKRGELSSEDPFSVMLFTSHFFNSLWDTNAHANRTIDREQRELRALYPNRDIPTLVYKQVRRYPLCLSQLNFKFLDESKQLATKTRAKFLLKKLKGIKLNPQTDTEIYDVKNKLKLNPTRAFYNTTLDAWDSEFQIGYNASNQAYLISLGPDGEKSKDDLEIRPGL